MSDKRISQLAALARCANEVLEFFYSDRSSENVQACRRAVWQMRGLWGLLITEGVSLEQIYDDGPVGWALTTAMDLDRLLPKDDLIEPYLSTFPDGATLGIRLPNSVAGIANLRRETRRPVFSPLRPNYGVPNAIEAMESTLSDQPRLVIDFATNSVTLDGTQYPGLDPNAVRILQTIQASETVTSVSRLRVALGGCHHDTTFRRWMSKLPPPLRSCIKGKRGSGIYFELPPLASEV